MSEREKALQLFDTIPEYKLRFLIAYMQGLTADEFLEPNEETVCAMRELEDGKGTSFDNVDDLWRDLEE